MTNILERIVRLEQVDTDYKQCYYRDIPLRNNENWFVYFERIRPMFYKKHLMYTASDVDRFYVDITNHQFKLENVSNGFINTYLQQYFPDMFENMKYWPVKYTTVELVNEQFKLLQRALLKSKKVSEKTIKEKKETVDPKGTKRVEEVEKVIQVVSYDLNIIAEFESHVKRNGKLLGSYWDYRDINGSIIEEAIEEHEKFIQRKKMKQNTYKEYSQEELKKLYAFGNKFNLNLVMV
jgi:hypothetical protein